jgi:hypothetical protein
MNLHKIVKNNSGKIEMNLTSLLTKLDNMLENNEKQSDKYFEMMRDFISTEAGHNWTKQHDKLFDSMQSRIKDARIYKWIVAALSILVLLSVFYLSLNSAWFSTKIKQNEALIELARQSTLPLEIVTLDSNANWLNVRIEDRFNDLSSEQQKQLKEIIDSFPSLGRVYGLHKNSELDIELTKNEIIELMVSPKNNQEIIGKIKFDSQLGVIWPTNDGATSIESRQQFPLNEKIQYLDDSDSEIGFYLVINEFNKNNRWEIQFAEKNKELSNVYYIPKTIKSAINKSLYIIYTEGWDYIYALTLTVGTLGGDNSGEFAWNLKSIVRRIKFN